MKHITVSLFAASLSLVSQATAAQTDTYGLHAVPIPGKVDIDGNLRPQKNGGKA